MKYLLCFILFFLVNCTGQEMRMAEIQVSDDLQVVENEQPVHEGAFWTISETPTLEIGAEDHQDDAYMFHRLMDAIRLNDEQLMVSNAGSSEIREFDLNGNHIRSFGRRGRGPGEFAEWSSMHIYRMPGDSIAVNDQGNERIITFDAQGNPGNTIITEPIEGAGNPTIIGRFIDGSWLVWSTVGSARIGGEQGDLIEKYYMVHRLHEDGEYDTPLFSFPNQTQIVHEYGGSKQFPIVPLMPGPIYSVDGNNRIIYSSSRSPEISIIDQSGVQTAEYRWNMPRTAVSDIWDRYRDNYLSAFSDPTQKAYYADFLRQDLPVPDDVPALESVHVDRLGYFWVKPYQLPWQESTTREILSPDGEWLGSLTLPEGVSLFEIGEDYILGKKTAESGVEMLVMYDLTR